MVIRIPKPEWSDLGPPPPGRHQLRAPRFCRKEGNGSWYLRIQEYYSRLLNYLHPALSWKQTTKWHACEYGRVYTYFDDLSEAETELIESFCRDFREYIVLGAKGDVSAHFAGGLDFCLALDFIRESPLRDDRTEVGQLEYRAKYRKCRRSARRLVTHLQRAFRRIPAPTGRPVCMAYVPPDPDKTRRHEAHLPTMIARGLARRLNKEGMSVDLVDSSLLCGKTKIKDLQRVEQKIAEWQQIVEAGDIQLSSGVDNHLVYVVDDLYQSGVSINAFARFLKSKGASHVLGLVCVKSLSDAGNV